MCQYGAQSMAKGGADAAAILRTYYPGATVVRAYR
jgi:peptidoglycan hydrolase-like amidase